MLHVILKICAKHHHYHQILWFNEFKRGRTSVFVAPDLMLNWYKNGHTCMSTCSLVRNHFSKTGRITLRIAASFTLYTKFGLMWYLFVFKIKQIFWQKAILVKRRHHRRNRGLFCRVRLYFLDGLNNLEYRWSVSSYVEK